LVEELIRIGGIPKLLQGYPEVIARYVGGLRKDLLLLEGWVASGLRPIPVPIAVFAGVRDQLVAVDRCRRWERMTTSSFWFETIEGDHFFLQTHASDVVGHLRQIADAVRIQDQSSADGHNL